MKFLFSILMLTIVFAQNKTSTYQEQIKDNIIREFTGLYGEGWEFIWNLNNTPHRIIGNSIPHSFNIEDPIETEYAARSFINQNLSIFNVQEQNLDLWVNEKIGNIRYVIFNQVYHNIPVWNGRIDLRYQTNGDLVMIGNDAFPLINIDIKPKFSDKDALAIAQEHVNFDLGLDDEVIDNPELFIWVEKALEPIYHLAWVIEVFVHSTDPTDHVPVHRWKIFVDAHTGDILDKFDQVRMASIDGYVTGSVKDQPYGISQSRGLQHVKVDVAGVGTTYTDENGYYSIDIGNTSREVTVKLEGSYLNINNSNGGDASITRTISPGTSEDFSFASINSISGERDTYYHANLIHDHVKSIDGSFTGADYVMPAAVNIGSEDSYWPCNAYWDYTGINLFSEGGGCAATDQMADVIYHEYGHGLQQFIYDPYSPPYNSSGLSEGCSDYWGMTLMNSPCLGNGFFGQGTCLRDGNNTLQYPASSCGGGVHCLGQYIMGSLWKMRENLIELHGYEDGVEISDNLFYWAQTGRPSNDLDFLYEIYLADDNDGNLQNGSANYSQICTAFSEHNLSISTLPECDAAFADLSISAPSLNFDLGQNEIASEDIIISNVGEEGSVMYYSTGVSPFSEIGDGPDMYGNFWSDSDIDEDIQFDWIDIDGIGTQYDFSDNDQAGSLIDLDFSFPFLGQEYTQFFINPNGWIGFGDDLDAWENSAIPSSSAPNAAIFGLWDDLNPVNDNCNSYCSGNVYYYQDGEKLVVWFNEVAHWWTNFENSYYDFQFVLYPDGKIDLNYNTLTGTHAATVGIQGSSNEGMQVAFNQSYLHDQLSLKFSQGPDWIAINPSSGELNAGESDVLTVTASAEGLDQGLYAGYLRLVTGGGNAGLNVSMLVSNSNIINGDINTDTQVNIQDIVLLINFILNVDSPSNSQFSAGDVNGDDLLNVQDVILIMNIILQ